MYRVADHIAGRLQALEQFGGADGWVGKKVSCLGDSLTGQNRWAPFVETALGADLVNLGVGGSKISKPDASASTVSMCDDARINAIATDSDAVLFQGGTNDWAQSVPLGTIASTDNTTFYGALKQAVEKILTRVPTALVCIVTVPHGERITVISGWADGRTNALGLTTAAYAQAQREVAALYGLPLIDWAAECGWSAYNVAAYIENDGAYFHPSIEAGGPRLAAVTIGRLRDLEPVAV